MRGIKNITYLRKLNERMTDENMSNWKENSKLISREINAEYLKTEKKKIW